MNKNDDVWQVKWDFKEMTKNCKNPLITHPCPDEINHFFNQPERTNPEDTSNKTYYRSDDGVYDKLESCICDVPSSENI